MADTKTYKWAHHTTYDGQQVAPGDSVDMDPETARGYITAGMLQVDPENPVQMAQALGDPIPSGAFDPSAKNADEVITYLSTADEGERQRVLAAEAEGKARSSVLNS